MNLIMIAAIAVPGLVLASIITSNILANQKVQQEKEIIINKLEAEAFEYASELVHDNTTLEEELYERSEILSKKFNAVKALKSEIGV